MTRVTTLTPEERIARAREMLGVPFLHQGRDTVGIDCVGVLIHAHAYTAKVPTYPRDPFNQQLEKQLDAIFGEPLIVSTYGVPASDLQEGDVVAMAYAKQVRHVAMVAKHPTIEGQLSLIHSDSSLEKVTEHILDLKWQKRIRRVYRL